MSDSSLSAGQIATVQLQAIKANFSASLSEADALLGNYSAQYSALTTQSKKQMPSPSDAQSQMSSAESELSAAEKMSDPIKALAAANGSLAQLLSVRDSLQAAMSSLKASAGSSLQVAKVAAQEVQQKAGQIDAQAASQIQDELSRAENFYSNALYADSLVSSDNVIKAANALLSQQSGGIDIKTILLGAVSLLFIAAVAYYFLNSQKKKPEEKMKEVPKA